MDVKPPRRVKGSFSLCVRAVTSETTSTACDSVSTAAGSEMQYLSLCAEGFAVVTCVSSAGIAHARTAGFCLPVTRWGLS